MDSVRDDALSEKSLKSFQTNKEEGHLKAVLLGQR